MNGHHCIGRLFFKYHEFCSRTINLLTVEQKYAALETGSSLSQYYIGTIIGNMGVSDLSISSKKTEGIFQKTNPLKFQKSYLKFDTLFSLIITIFLLKKSSLQGKKHKEPTCGSLVLFGWLRSTRATQALGRSFRTSRDLGANGFYVSL